MPHTAQAASFTAGTEQQFRDALTAAAASPDAQSTITLTAGFALAAPVTLPSKNITLDPAGFTITGLTFTGGTGNLVVTGGGLVPLVGANTTPAFAVSGSEVRLESGATVAAASSASLGNSGRLIIDGLGSKLTTGTLTVGNPGGATALHVQNGGAVRATGASTFALGGSAVDVLVTGAGSRMDFDSTLGFGTAAGTSNGSWTISDRAAVTVAQGLTVGSQTTNQATPPELTVTGAGASLGVGSLAFYRGAVSVLNGGALTTGTLNLGPRINNGTANLLIADAGSRLVATGAVTLGNSPGQAIVTLARGGVLEAKGSFTAGGATAVGVLNIGGTEGGAAAAAGVLDTATVTLGAGGRLNFNHTDADYDFAPAIAGGGTINHRAGGTHLAGDGSAFTGAVQIVGGTLYVDSVLGTAASLLQVSSGGTLGGSGRFGGDVIVQAGGVVAPGDSPGTLTIDGDLTLASTSRLAVEFGESGVVGGPLNDLIKVGGLLTLDGVVDITVSAGGVFDAGLYRIASYGTLDDRGLALGSAPGGGAGISIQTVIPGQVNLVNTGGLAVNFWDGDGGGSSNNGRVEGGAGTWTGASLNWTTGAGAVNAAYNPGDFLIFAGSAGTVNVGAVSSNTGGGLQFAVDGYRLTGGAITLANGAHTVRVGDGTADGKSYVAVIDSALGGAGGLTKTDLGALVVGSDYSYSGTTTVQAGTLLFNGAYTGVGANALVVGANGTIGGTGQVRGGVINGTLAPGGLTGAGTLTSRFNITLGAGATLRYRLGQAGTAGGALNDLFVVNGNLTLNGTLNVTQSAGGAFGAGVYRLIDYSGILTDNILDVGSLPSGYTGTIQTSIAKQVNLLVAAIPGGGPGPGGPGGGTTPPPPPKVFNFWDGAGAAGDRAITGGDGTWRAGATNWTTSDGAANGTYDQTLAIFAGTGGAVSVDGSAGAIEVGGLQFAADGYRLSGDPIALKSAVTAIRVGDGTTAGADFTARIGSVLSGAGGLDKTDGGTLILTAANTYAGGTRVSGGVLQLGDGGKAGSVQGDVRIDGVLAFNRADDVVFAGALSGGGTLAQIGAGATTLSADSGAFTGLTEVRAGTLTVDGALGGLVAVFGGGKLTGAGKVGSLNNQTGGVVAPGHGDIGVLTVSGDYAGSGGVLELDARLGAAPAADQLVVRGSTSGETLVRLNRLSGAAGPLDPDGLVLVQVDGASNGVFALAAGDYRLNGEAVLVNGAYGYALRKDSGGDWRLRSGDGAGAPLYQPGVPVYEAFGQVLQLLNGVGTLRERSGERQWSAEAGTGVWGRLEGGRSKLTPRVSTSGAGLEADRWKLQFGIDQTLSDELAGGRLTGGLTGHYGEVSADVASANGAGEIDAKGYGVGASLTWTGAGGGYVDAQAQASWFDGDLKSRLLGVRAEGVNGDGYALSLEGGRAFAAGARLRLAPQAQLSYSQAKFDGFTDPFGAKVSSDRAASLVARVGVAADYALGERGGVYAQIDVSQEVLDGVRVDVSGVRLEAQPERTWGGLTLGGSYDWGDGRYVVYGQGSADTSLSAFGDSYEVTGTAGFRMRF